MLSIDEKIKRETASVKQHLEEGFSFIKLRGKLRPILPYDIKFIKGQTSTHNIFMKNDHTWEESDNKTGMYRTCSICGKTQMLSGDKVWTNTLANTNLTQEDILELILRSELMEKFLSEPTLPIQTQELGEC